MYDVIIVGAGPAGMTAAIFASRRKLKTLVISKDVGGQTAIAHVMENYPGYKAITGHELMTKFDEQMRSFDVEMVYGEIKKLKIKTDAFVVDAGGTPYDGRSVILAFGKTPRSLNVSGEKEYIGKGVSYCASCDAPLFKNKVVAVVGGGNSALDAALLLAKIAKKVFLVHRRDEFRAEKILEERARKAANIEMVLGHVPIEIKGDKFVTALAVQDANTKKERELRLDGVFVEIGYEVKTEFLKGVVNMNHFGEIIVNNSCETSVPGIFAAGDVTDVPFKQTVIAAGEGAKAALAAYRYLQGGAAAPDWSVQALSENKNSSRKE